MRRFSLLLYLFVFSASAFADDSESITAADYIAQWKDEAIYQMVMHRIPASITLAQGMLESGNGNSSLAINGNNHFGIKCHEWTGETIHQDDDIRHECFRKYSDARESFEDHSLFLQRKRYESLFSLAIDDYRAWAKGLKECGYATNPKYPQLLIKLIEDNALHQYDGVGKDYIKKNKFPDRAVGVTPRLHLSEKEKRKIRKGRSEELPEEIHLSQSREIKISGNHIKYTVAKAGDTPRKIADDLDIHVSLLRRYNDLTETSVIQTGEVIYIQPKRNRGKETTYRVKAGDTLWAISQYTGVKLKKLRSRNQLQPDQEPAVGAELKLR